MSAYTVVFAELSSTEMERMTEVSTAIQRVWRSRGFLAPLSGTRAKFNIVEAASLAIRYRLSLQGHTPANTKEVGDQYANQLVYWALMYASGICEILAPSRESLALAEHAYFQDEQLIADVAGIDPAKAERFLISSDDRAEIILTSDLTEAQDSLAMISGTFIDLQLLAERFALKAGHPLIGLYFDGTKRGSSPAPFRRVVGESRTRIKRI